MHRIYTRKILVNIILPKMFRKQMACAVSEKSQNTVKLASIVLY